MKEIGSIAMDKNLYNEIVRYISELTLQRFYYLNLADDIANSILVSFMQSSTSTDPYEHTKDYIKSVFPKAVEDVFSYYQKLTLQYCLTKTKDHSVSEDISQEAIRQLLSSQKNPTLKINISPPIA